MEEGEKGGGIETGRKNTEVKRDGRERRMGRRKGGGGVRTKGNEELELVLKVEYWCWTKPYTFFWT